MAVHILGHKHYEKAQLQAWAPVPADLDEWANRFDALHTLVMEDASNRPLGFVSWRNDGYINLIFVRPDVARKSVASHLLAAAEVALPNIEELHVHASLIARPFFERNGYRVIAEEFVTRADVELKRYAMVKEKPAT